MQKFLKPIFFAIIFACYSSCAFASGGITISAPNLTIEVGSTNTFVVTATNTIGDVSIASSNPDVAQVDVSEWSTGMIEEGQTKSGTITVTGVHEGSAVVTLTLDAATFDGEDLAGRTLTIAVNVIAQQSPPQQEPQQPQQPTPAPSSPPASQPTSSSNNSAPSAPASASPSTDDALEDPSVDDHKPQKNDDRHHVGNQNLSSTTESDDTADSSDATNKSSGSFSIILIIIGVVVLVAAGVAVFLIMKKRSFR